MMSSTVNIAFRGIEQSQVAREEIEERVEKLQQFFDHIQSVRVTVESPHNHSNKGNIYQVHIAIHVPGKEIIINKGKDNHQAHEDMSIAIRDAFDAADRQIQEFSRKIRGDVKTPSESDGRKHGIVSKIFLDDGYGFIDRSGGEVYFNENSVLNNAFSSLKVGAEVKFVEEMGEKGPQASTVYNSMS